MPIVPAGVPIPSVTQVPTGSVSPTFTGVPRDSVLEVVSSVACDFYWDARALTQASNLVSSWTDLSGNSRHAVQATANKKPTYLDTDPYFGGMPSVTFDGTDDELVATVASAAPGTTPVFYWWIGRTVNWVATRRVFGAPVTTHLVYQNLNTPELSQYNGGAVNANNGAPVGVAKRGEAYFSNSASDYLKLGSKSVAGGLSAGNLGGSATFAMGSENGSSFGNVSLFCLARFVGRPSTTELDNLSALAYRLCGGVTLT